METLTIAMTMGMVAVIQVYGARRSVGRLKERWVADDEMERRKTTLTVSKPMLVLFPLAASMVLLMSYFAPTLASVAITLVLLVGAEQGFVFVASPLLERFRRRFPRLLSDTAVHFAAVALLVLWLMTGSAALNNVFGGVLCCMFITLVEVPSLHLAALLLGALFCYDLWWVFGSAAVFGRSLTATTAAATAAINPVHVVAAALGVPLPPRWFVPTLQPPVRFVFAQQSGSSAMQLGLGDVALPGLLLAYFARFDAASIVCSHRSNSKQQQYVHFELGLSGYVLGLCFALLTSMVLQQPQPALLYVVPLIIVPPVIYAAGQHGGTLSRLWAPDSALFATKDATDAPIAVDDTKSI